MPSKPLRYPLAIVGFALAGLAIVACTGTPEEEITESAVPVEMGNITVPVRSAGSISIAQKADLRFGVAGEVAEVLVAEGDSVEAGQVLALLESGALEVAVVQAKAKLAGAQDALDKLLEPSSELDLALARAGVEEAQGALANAQAEETSIELSQAKAMDDAQRGFAKVRDDYLFLFRKYYGIYVEDADALDSPDALLFAYPKDEEVVGYRMRFLPSGVAQTDIDDELDAAWVDIRQANVTLEKVKVNRAKAVTSAARAVTQARGALQVALDKVESLEAGPDAVQVQHKEADLAGSRQALADAEGRLAKTTLKAPTSGVITSVSAEPGDSANANTVVMAMADPGSIEVSGRVDEMDVFSVREGQRVLVSPTAFPNVRVPGRVERISLLPMAQQGAVSYPIIVSIDPPQQAQLRDGMSVTITIVVNEVSNVLLIPVGAVRRQEGITVVEIVGDDGTRETREVELGLSDGQRIEVRSGLSRDDVVVVRAGPPSQSDFLRQGSGLGVQGQGRGRR
jgi:HlyD family secretion protein